MGGDDIRDMIDSIHDEGVVEKARLIRSSGRFVKISGKPEIYVYLGDREDHVVVDSIYCSCTGFQTRLAQGRPTCSHVVAVRLGLSRHRSLTLPPGDVARIVWEVLTGGLTGRLRKIIHGLE